MKTSRGFAEVLVVAIAAVIALGGLATYSFFSTKNTVSDIQVVDGRDIPPQVIIDGNVGSGGKVITAATGVTSLGGLTGATQTFVDDTNVSMVSSGTTHTLTWLSTLAVGRGGSGAGTLTGILIGNGTSAFTADAIPLNVANGGTATTTLQNQKIFYSDGTTYKQAQQLDYDVTNDRFGVASSSPAYRLSIGSGAIGIEENDLATSTSMTIDARDGNQQLIRTGTSATTIAFSNFGDGVTIRLVVCNPGASAGAITWSGVHYFGGAAPTQTTTTNQCDMYVVGATQATSTTDGAPIIWLSQGGAGLQ